MAYTMTLDTKTDQEILKGLLEGTLTSLTDNNITYIPQYGLQSNALAILRLLNLESTNSYALANSIAFTQKAVLSKITSLTSYLFANSGLLTCIIPSCTSISSSSFNGCSKLTTLIVGTKYNDTVCTLSGSLPTKFGNGTAVIYVPDTLKTQYQGATNWTTYSSIIKGISELETNDATLWAEYQDAMEYV